MTLNQKPTKAAVPPEQAIAARGGCPGRVRGRRRRGLRRDARRLRPDGLWRRAQSCSTGGSRDEEFGPGCSV